MVALLGTGLATIALALLAHDLAGPRAGSVLGTALAIKMIAYVAVAPIAGAVAARLPRRGMLISLDLVRAGLILALPFVDQVWQIYVLIFLLQSASAAFTPTFQATIPDILEDERTYTEALSLSRLAYDLENLISPMLASLLLLFLSFHLLFAGTAIGFVISALLVASVTLPARRDDKTASFAERMTRGLRIFVNTPRLLGLIAVNFTVAAGGAAVLVNTVIYVRERLGLGESDLALTMAAFGLGSMALALLVPRLLDHLPERRVMLAGAWLTGASLLASPWIATTWPGLLFLWLLLGAGNGAMLTPAGRLLRRSATTPDRPAVFSAQFSLSHACWLLTYPLAGWAGAALGLDVAALLLLGIALPATLAATAVWPRRETDRIAHVHTDLPPDDPHIQGAVRCASGFRHSHEFVIDERHTQWPGRDGSVTRRK